MRCPICDKTIEGPRPKTMPFCSERCRTIDLGRWLDEAYAFPGEPLVDEEGGGRISEDSFFPER